MPVTEIDARDNIPTLKEKTQEISDDVGDLDLLETTNKDSLVASVNEIATEITATILFRTMQMS